MDKIDITIGDLRNENNRLRLLRIGKNKQERKKINKQIAKNIVSIKNLKAQISTY